MKSFVRAGLTILGAVLVCLSSRTHAQGLHLSSIQLTPEGAVRLALSESTTQSVHVEASADFKSWIEVGNDTPDQDGFVSVTDPTPDGRREFFRVFMESSGGTSSNGFFVATVKADLGGVLTNATVTVVTSNKRFTTDVAGKVSIPVADLTFDSGFRLKVEAPGYVSETMDLPPAIYSYTFSLMHVAMAPESIVNRTYSLGADSITLYDDGLFRLQTTNGVSAGAYFAERSTTIDDTWSIKAAGTTSFAEIGLAFTTTNSGRFTNVVESVTSFGNFAEGVFTNVAAIQPSAPPPSIKTLRFITLDTPLGPGLDFTVTLTGTVSGTFLIDGAFMGEGTFHYTAGANGAQLRLDYSDEFKGDFDDFTLTFLEGAGLGSKVNTFSGTMSAEGNVGPVMGTFSYDVGL